jgi:hypothetical protein
MKSYSLKKTVVRKIMTHLLRQEIGGHKKLAQVMGEHKMGKIKLGLGRLKR